jgi:CXXX repeat peptide maturase
MIVQLCDSSVSFCHYISQNRPKLIPIYELKECLLWSVKRNLKINVLYPRYKLPDEYKELLENFPITKIASEDLFDADIKVLNGWETVYSHRAPFDVPTILHTTYVDFIKHYYALKMALCDFSRLNVIFTDVQSFTDASATEYESVLMELCDEILSLYKEGRIVQLNIITDRTMLTHMNNCNAGVETITFAPNGNFYPCAAFYFDKQFDAGNLKNGLLIPNQHLFELDYAPICRICDAFQCKRCLWLNHKLTLEVNTPSHQQCVMSHIERKVAKMLLERIREFGVYAPEIEIPEIQYNDPFEKIIT